MKLNETDSVFFLQSIFQDERLISFYNNYHQIINKFESKWHFNYWGINFKNDAIDTVKFYVHFMEELSDEDVQKFFPDIETYKKYSSSKSKKVPFGKTNVGSVFTLKFKKNNPNVIRGFYFMIDQSSELYKETTVPNTIPLELHNHCVSKSINIEVSDEIVMKKYFYFDDKESLSFFALKFNFILNYKKYFIEYAQFGDKDKCNVHSFENTEILKTSYFNAMQKEVIKQVLTTYPLNIYEIGCYHNNTKSIYFFNKDRNSIQTVLNQQ